MDWDLNPIKCITRTITLNSYLSGDSRELLQIPSWDFDHTIIQAWFEAGSGGVFFGVGDGIPQDREGDPQGQFGSHIGQGVPCCLTGQGGASGQSGVHFNDVVLQTTQNSSV